MVRVLPSNEDWSQRCGARRGTRPGYGRGKSPPDTRRDLNTDFVRVGRNRLGGYLDLGHGIILVCRLVYATLLCGVILYE